MHMAMAIAMYTMFHVAVLAILSTNAVAIACAPSCGSINCPTSFRETCESNRSCIWCACTGYDCEHLGEIDVCTLKSDADKFPKALFTCDKPQLKPADTRPNILFILADDLGYGDVSVYPNPTSKPRILTPNLAQMAKDGMKFTDAYAGYSVCAPSRRTLMTGYHTGHFESNNGGPELLSNKSVTVAHLLRDAGYNTRLIGKWGLDGNFEKPQPPGIAFPTVQGFNGFYGQSDQFQCHDYYPPFMFNNSVNITITKNVGASVATCGHDYSLCSWSADLWTMDALDWISKQTPDVPWFLYLAYTSPHAGAVGNVGEDDVPGPRVSSGPYFDKYNGTWPTVEINFATTIWEVDGAIGEVLKTLDTTNQADNTIVFFSSDNGAHQEGGHKYLFFNSSGPLNGFKRSIHDGGHRAAFLVRWPGHVAAGAVNHHQLCFYDFLPTAAAIAVASESVPPTVDGHSFLPTLLGQAQAQPKFIYHDYGGCDDPVTLPKYISRSFGQNIRYGNWSGVCIGDSKPCVANQNSTFFLYDMSIDQGQTNDVAATNPQIVSLILDVMKDQYNTSWDPAMSGPSPPKPNPGPHPAPGPCTEVASSHSRWIGGTIMYNMSVAADGVTVKLATTTECCAWHTAEGTLDQKNKVRVIAPLSRGGQLNNVGVISQDGCEISWSKRWAPWVKQV